VPSSTQELGEASEYSRKLLTMYGPFAVVLHSRIKNFKLIKLNDNNDFLGSLIEFYLKNIHEVYKTKDAFKNIKTLVDFFPSSKRFMSILKYHKQTAKEKILLKLVIDILENFYRATGRPLFEKLRSKVFPLAMRFYGKMKSEILTDINLMIRSKTKKSISS